MVAGGLAEKARPMLHRSALRVRGGKINPPEPGKGNRPRAHGAGLQRHIEIAADQPFRADFGRRLANGQHFGMCGGVPIGQSSVAGRRQKLAVAQNYGPHRHFAEEGGFAGLIKGERKRVLGGHAIDFLRRILLSGHMSDNRDQKSRGPRKPDRASKGGKPAGKSFGKPGSRPGGRAEGKSFDKPAGRSFEKPAGRSFDKPAGRNFDKPAGRSFDKPAGRSFEKSAGRSFDKSAQKPRRVSRPPQPETPSTFAGERIAKVMARVGLCSRRDAELWVSQGRVAVNGEKLSTPAVNVTPEDRITVDGKPLAARERTRLFMFHKPRGYVTTDRDPEGRATIFDALPEGLPRLVSIGRLDINTEGLILLTNDGGLARVLELPSTGWLRRYRVRANGTTDQAQLDDLRKGIVIEGIEYAGIEAHLDRVQGANVWLTMGLREGKNREIKRVLEHLGLAVNRLIRLSYGPFQLGDLEEGAVDEVRTRVLMEQLGPVLSEEAGCDFHSPIIDRTIREEAEPAPLSRPQARKMTVQDEEPAPRKEKPAPRTRKHVSVLRAARDEPTTERRRVERAETADRKGRAVSVERIKTPGKKAPATRNGRRFSETPDEKDVRARGATFGERPRTGRNAKEAPRSMDRRGERPRAYTRDAAIVEPDEFKPWNDKPRSEKPRGDFKPRSEGNPRSDFKSRSASKTRGEFKSRSEKPAGKPSGRPLGKPSDKAGGGRPGGKPGGRPSSGGPRGPRTPR